MEHEKVQLRETDTAGVLEVRLNRPDRHNALDGDLFEGLIQVGQRLGREPSLRAVVLSGEGRSFCAGLDTETFGKLATGKGLSGGATDLATRTHGGANMAQYAAMVWRDVPVPVIAAVHGVAFGGGLQVALGADLRYAAPDSRWSVMEIKWGLVPDMGGMVLLNELVRPDLVRELCYSGRVFSGEEALQLGLVTRLSTTPREEALAFAGLVADKSPDAIRAMKRLMNQAATPPERVEQVLLAESREQDAIIGQFNQAEAVQANLEKRAPVFRDVDLP